MPSMSRCGRSVRSTRSLNVPGSPSSALQITKRRSASPPAAKRHLRPVTKPAPPQPLRPLSSTVVMIWVGVMLTALFRPASLGTGPSRDSPAWRMLLSTMRLARSRGEEGVKPGTAIFSGFSPALRASATSRAFCGVSLVTTTSLIMAAGAWSHMPMHGVYSSEKAPSSDVSPILMPSADSNSLTTLSRPAKRSMMSSHRRMVTRPFGASEKKV